MFNKFSKILEDQRKKSWVKKLKETTKTTKTISPTRGEEKTHLKGVSLEHVIEDENIDPESMLRRGFLLELNKKEKLPNIKKVLLRALARNQQESHAMIEWYGIDIEKELCAPLSDVTDNIGNYLNNGTIIAGSMYDICLAIISTREKNANFLEAFTEEFYEKYPEREYEKFFQSLFGKNEVTLPDWWPEESHIILLHMEK